MGRNSIIARRCVWSCLVLTGLGASTVQGQRLHVHTYSEADGLGSTTVKGIAQAPDGLMWFATRAGITSYDGFRFHNYLIKDGLPQADHGMLCVDGRGTLWAISTTTPVRASYFDGQRWIAVASARGRQPGDLITGAVLLPDNDELLVATNSGELLMFNGEAWCTVLPASSVLKPSDLDTTPYGVLMSTNRGLIEVDPHSIETPISTSSMSPPGPVWGVGPRENGDGLWIVGPGWIALSDGEAADLVISDQDMACTPETGPFHVVADGVGGVLFGNPSCLYRFSFPRGLQDLGLPSGVAAASATSIHRDREGHVWVASDRGLSKIVDWRFISYDARHGLYADEVTAVLQRRSGEMVLGSTGGLTLLGAQWATRIHLADHHQLGRVLDLAEAEDGRILAAVHSSGLATIGAAGEVQWHADPAFEDVQVSAVLFDQLDTLWVSTNHSIWKQTPTGFVSMKRSEDDRVPIAGARRLYLGPRGHVYAATCSQGLFRFDADVTHQWRADSAPANNVFAICETRAGRVYVGTVVGLYEVVEDRLIKAAGMQDIERPVYFISEDDLERLWIGTDYGVFRWDGKTMVHFGTSDGLIGTETNRATGLFDDRGHLWIGTDRGVTVYRPEYDNLYSCNPEIQLVDLEAAGRRRMWSDELSLNHDENSVSFGFRVVTFGDERRVRVRTWLEGIEDDWGAYEASPTREIRHTHLPPGRYRLHLQAMSVGGQTSPPCTSPWFTIRPPLWTHPGFVVLVALAAIALFYSLIASVLSRRYARRLREEVRLRTAELHESETKRQRMEQEQARSERLEALGILAGGIAHDFNNLLTVMMGNLSAIEQRADFDRMAQSCVNDALLATERARGLTRQLLTFAKGGAPVRKAAAIAEVIRENVEFSLRGSNLHCEFDLPDDLWFVEIDGSQISQVLNNLLINARQAMPGGGVVNLRARNLEHGPAFLEPGRYVAVEIEDHGTGIAPDQLGRVFDPYYSTKEQGSGLGLAIAFSIIEKHLGRLVVDSVLGVGSVFRFYLPACTSGPETPIPQRAPATVRCHGRILVMDDDIAVRDVVAMSLSRMGYDVDGATCGDDAIAQYRDALGRAEPYDVVVLDLTIRGGMGGLEAVRELRTIDPDVRAIAASGYSEDMVMADAVSFGFCGQIAKPFRPLELAEVVDRVMDGREPVGVDERNDQDPFTVDHE